MKTSRRVLLGITLLLLLAAAAVTPLAAQSEPTVTVRDALGREVQVPRNPDRVTAAGRAVLMIADAVYLFPSARESLTAVTRIDQGKGNFLRDLDPRYRDKQILERNAGPEQIAASRPDVVLLKDFMKGSIGDAVASLGIPVVYLRLETPEDYRRDIRTLGRIFGAEDRAEEVLGYYEERLGLVADRTAGLTPEERPSALFVYYSSRGNEGSVNVPPSGWIQTSLLETAGADPVWTEAVTGGGWQTVNLEQVLSWNPAELFVVSYRQDIDAVMRRIRGDSRWRSLDAASDDGLHAFPVDYYSWDQPDVRWILGLQWLAKTLHPELFPDFEMRELTTDFFRRMYGMTEAEVEEIIFSKLQGDFEPTR